MEETGLTVHDALVTALTKLNKKKFKRFKKTLSGWKVSEPYINITQDQLEGGDPSRVAELIRRHYEDSYGTEVTLAVLEAIHGGTVREELQHDLQKVLSLRTPATSASKAIGHQYRRLKATFMDNCRSDLIRKITVVNPVLQDLRDQGRLTQEQYEDLSGKPSSLEKMRGLCDIIRHWDDEGKFVAYIALREHNYAIIRDIEMTDWARRHNDIPDYSTRMHYIEKHRLDVVHDITNMESVLDDLLDEKLLTQEQYEHVRRYRPSWYRMGELCDIAESWDDIDKDLFYLTLRKHNYSDIRRIERGWDDHFVDRHREALIRRITVVDPVLDDLLEQRLLTQETYDDLIKKTTSEDKMRDLYINNGRIWDYTEKDTLYLALRKHNYTIIRKLERDMKLNTQPRMFYYRDILSKHRSALIRRIMMVDPVLDDLLDQKLLTQEQYNDLCNKPTSEDKMRDLCDTVPSWSYYGKEEKVYMALRRYNPWVIRGLELKDRYESRTLSHSSATPDHHFVDRHRSDIIRRIILIDPVLDDLREKRLLTKEQYDDLCKYTTYEDKTRALCDIVSDWGDAEKDTFHMTLKIYNDSVIMDMELEDRTLGFREPYSSDHFVDRHRADLTERITVIYPVLDDLLGHKLLTQKQYNDLIKKRTSVDKMRDLYGMIKFWHHTDKDVLYLSLRTHNYNIVRDLEGDQHCLQNYKMERQGGPDLRLSWEETGERYRYEQVHGAMRWNHARSRSSSTVESMGAWADPSDSRQANIEDSLWKPDSALIRRIMMVDPVLDDLLDLGLLTQEQYNDLYMKPTSEDKMRDLCHTVRSWGYYDKEEVAAALRRHNRYVMEDLDLEYQDQLRPVFHSMPTQTESSHNPWGSSITGPIFTLQGPVVSSKDFTFPSGTTGSWKTQNIPEVESDEESLSSPITGTYPQSLVKKTAGEPLTAEPSSSDIKDPLMEKSEKMISSAASCVRAERQQMECKLCGKAQYSNDVVIPILNGSTYRLKLKCEGLFRCQKTGIQFLVKHPVTIQYNLESWHDHLTGIQGDRFEVVGPLFNIKTDDPYAVSAVYLPHYLCIAGFTGDKSQIKCAHFKDGNMTLEPPTQIKPFYIILENPSFSCLGPLLSLVKKKVPIHGGVLIYFRVVCQDEPEYQEYKIHLYLLPYPTHTEEALDKKNVTFGLQRINKPPHTCDTVYTRIKYLVRVQPGASIIPKKLKFQSEPYQYTEINLKANDTNIYLNVSEEESEPAIWEAQLTKGDIRDWTRQMAQPPHQRGKSLYKGSFVDKHREVLIREVHLVEPVLDGLKSAQLLTDEQYDVVRSRTTSQQKMRALYDSIRSWGDGDKSKLYNILKDNNGPLIRKLKQAAVPLKPS